MASVSKESLQHNLEAVKSKEDIINKRYIPPRKGQPIINELRLVP